MRPGCARDLPEIQPRCARDTAEIQPRFARLLGECRRLLLLARRADQLSRLRLYRAEVSTRLVDRDAKPVKMIEV